MVVPVPAATEVALVPFCWDATETLEAQKIQTVAEGVAAWTPLPVTLESVAGRKVEQAESLVEPPEAGRVVVAPALVDAPKLKKPEQPGPSVADPDVPGAARAIPLARNQATIMATDTAASSRAVFLNDPSEGPTTFSLVFINPHLLVR